MLVVILNVNKFSNSHNLSIVVVITLNMFSLDLSLHKVLDGFTFTFNTSLQISDSTKNKF